METLYYVFTAVILLYLIAEIIMAKGIPDSISDSFYLLDKRRKGLGYLFTLWAWAVSLMFMILGFEYGGDALARNLCVLFSGAGLALVGAAPLFKDRHYKAVHFTGAIVAIVFAALFAAISPVWYLPLILCPTAIFIPYFIHRITYIYSIEVIMFTIICITLYSIMR